MVFEKEEADKPFTLKELSDFKKAEKEIDIIIQLKYTAGNKLRIFFKVDTDPQLREEIGKRYEKAGWDITISSWWIMLS